MKKYSKLDKKRQKNAKFYTSRTWRRKRKEILIRDNFECQMCKSEGKYSKAQCVHHIKELEDHPELALVDENLISLCFRCHNTVHDKTSNLINKPKKFISEERW